MYEYLILISDTSDFSMEGLEQNLRSFYARNEDRKVGIERIDDEITVAIKNFPFFIELSGAPHVLEESAEIAESWKGNPAEKSKIAACSRRLEMHAQGQDFNMDYFNDSLYILGEMETFEGIYVYDPGQDSFV